MNKVLKRILVTLLCLVLALLLAAGGYVAYMSLQYYRIEDDAPLAVENQQTRTLPAGGEFFALTYNIGFGAYDHDFSFFMDSGVMTDGTKVTGTSGRAASAEVVRRNTAGAVADAEKIDPDFLLLQEVDVDSDRSYHINQADELRAAFSASASVFASNFHSAYLAWPPSGPHGAVQSGLLTLSRYQISEAQRRSFPVDDSFPTKFFDLDRCFALHRVPVEGGGELVLINTHMSAYDEGGLIRARQMAMLAEVLAAERAKGNWVIAGGDFNHALCGSESAFESQQQVPEWVSVFDDAALPEGFSVVRAGNVFEVPTCRGSDMPWQPGVSYATVLDGFIVSDNVDARAENIDANFEHSDHNPVLLAFSLKGEQGGGA